MVFLYSRHGKRAKKLPKAVREYMVRRFHLLPEYLDILRCYEPDRKINGKRLISIYIYNLRRVEENHLSLESYLDLIKYSEMILFEGHRDDQGQIYIADRRPPIKSVKAYHKTVI